jgi:hypothetical protein
METRSNLRLGEIKQSRLQETLRSTHEMTKINREIWDLLRAPKRMSAARGRKACPRCCLRQAGDAGQSPVVPLRFIQILTRSKRQPRRWSISQDTAMHPMHPYCWRRCGGILTKPASAIRRSAGSRKDRGQEHHRALKTAGRCGQIAIIDSRLTTWIRRLAQ